ncbi:hypothetical protein AZE42_08787 [Rhizopogon vesiculosus]|uniref:Uncharacterized protein n=1 Tax=Rhizopogon vesiculosus TaxID=180088 RepID=A0A1J8QL54_9AGAM|nr:hypothetical protein AZE42_08787 [Rhizopogon vesiculosus]
MSFGWSLSVSKITCWRNSVVIINNRIYRHKVLRVNYTTDDLRRAQDSLNPRTQADIMAWFWPTKKKTLILIGKYHASVQHLDFLWVCWFARDAKAPSGWAVKQLPRVGFYDGDDPSAFGFINPDLVIRGVQLIPAL